MCAPGSYGPTKPTRREHHSTRPWFSPLERRLADLEGGEDALCFASGMAAITGLAVSPSG